MSVFEFLTEYVSANLELYIAVLLITTLVYFSLFRSSIYLYIDVFTILLFLFSIYTATIIFMYLIDIINIMFFLHYIITHIALLVGMLIFSPFKMGKKHSKEEHKIPEKFYEIMFFILGIVFLINEIYIRLKIGYPLLEGVSWTIFYQSVGINKRIEDILLPLLVLFLIRRMLKNQASIVDLFLGIIVFVNLALSGSKSAFSVLILSVSTYSYFNEDLKNRIKKYQGIIFFGLFSVFLVIVYFLYDSNLFLDNVFLSIAGRADLYIAYYGSDYSSIQGYFSQYEGIHNFLMDIFLEVLGIFRLLPYNELMLSLSEKIEFYVYGKFIDGYGMNISYNILSLVYFGWFWSIIYCFFIGLVYSFIRNKFIYLCASSEFMQLFYISLILKLNSLITSMGDFVNSVVYLLIGFITTSLISYFIYSCLYRKKGFN